MQHEADLEELIQRTTNEARLTGERAREGMKGLTLVQQTATAAATKLDTDVAKTRDLIDSTTALLDSLEAELKKKDADIHTWLTDLERDSARIDSDVLKVADLLRTADKNLNQRADDMAKSVKAKLVVCDKEVLEMKGFAGTQLQNLRGYKGALVKQLGDLRTAAQDVSKALTKAVNQVAAEHEVLDKVIGAQLTMLEQSYEKATSATERRLTELERELANLNSSADKHLDEVLVRKLGKELRKAADSFGNDLTKLEKELESVARGLGVAHQSFHKNLTQYVQPEIDKIAEGLHKAARNLGWI